MVAIVVFWCLPVSAQDDALGPDPVASELFRQGRELIAAGDHEGGCAKLELSMKRYAAPSTLMNIARCREREGRVATAWALYRRALVLNLETDGEQRRQELEAVGQQAIEALEPRLPHLRVIIKSPPEGVTVSEGGRELPLETSVPLDPGSHDLLAEAPGHVSLRRSITLREGETNEVTLELVPNPVAPKPPPPVAPTPDKPAVILEPSTPSWIWWVGGAGVVMTGVAVGFAIDAKLATDTLAERCGDDLVCNEDLEFDPDPDNARKNRGLALAIGFGAGALAALTTATIGLATSTNDTVAFVPYAHPQGAGFNVTTRF